MIRNEAQNQTSKTAGLIKRLGFAGFMFFLIKGLLWLIVPAVVAWFSLN